MIKRSSALLRTRVLLYYYYTTNIILNFNGHVIEYQRSLSKKDFTETSFVRNDYDKLLLGGEFIINAIPPPNLSMKKIKKGKNEKKRPFYFFFFPFFPFLIFFMLRFGGGIAFIMNSPPKSNLS